MEFKDDAVWKCFIEICDKYGCEDLHINTGDKPVTMDDLKIVENLVADIKSGKIGGKESAGEVQEVQKGN